MNNLYSIQAILKKAMAFDQSYQHIPIRECHEKLVDFQQIAEQTKLPVTFRRSAPYTHTKLVHYCRIGIVPHLIGAIVDFHKMGYRMRIEYSYRSYQEQKRLFGQKLQEVQRQYPTITANRARAIAGIFVASTPNTAAHVSGAAIDIRLLDKAEQIINMGVPYLFVGEESSNLYRRFSPTVIDHRQLLKNIMKRHGFCNYPFEYWHFSMGDKIASKISNQPYARYGPVDIKLKTREITYITNGDVEF